MHVTHEDTRKKPHRKPLGTQERIACVQSSTMHPSLQACEVVTHLSIDTVRWGLPWKLRGNALIELSTPAPQISSNATKTLYSQKKDA